MPLQYKANIRLHCVIKRLFLYFRPNTPVYYYKFPELTCVSVADFHENPTKGRFYCYRMFTFTPNFTDPGYVPDCINNIKQHLFGCVFSIPHQSGLSNIYTEIYTSIFIEF